MKHMYQAFMTIAFLVISITTVFGQPKKKVFIEEGTGTWCVWCPRGIVFAEQVIETYGDDVIVVAVHNRDPMENPLYNLLAGFRGFPSSHIDRQILDVDPSSWPSRLPLQLSKTPPANVYVDTEFDENTREIDITVRAEFFEDVSREYRLSAVVVEDAVTGQGFGYAQANAYVGGGNGQMGGYENLPNPVPASLMIYDYVGREPLTSNTGSAGSLPELMKAGETYEYSYSYTVPEGYDPNYIHVVGLLIDVENVDVVNAGKSAYMNGSPNAKPFFHTSPGTSAAVDNEYRYDIHLHDPHNPTPEIKGAVIPEWLTLSDNGDGTATLSGTPNTSGLYEISLLGTDGEWDVYQDFEIAVDVPADRDWEQLGSKIAMAETSNTRIDINEEKFLAGAFIDQTNSSIELVQYQRTDWKSFGTIENTPADQMAMTLADDQRLVYVAANEAGQNISVHAHDGNQSSKVGEDLEPATANGADLAYNNESLYLAFQSESANRVKVFEFNSDGWLQLGEDLAEGSANPKLDFDSEGNPVVLYASSADDNASSYAVKFVDGAWEQLSDQPVNEDGVATDHDLSINDKDEIFVAYKLKTDLKASVSKYSEENGWELFGDKISVGSINNIRIKADKNNRVIIAYEDAEMSDRISARIFNGVEWKPLGNPGISESTASLGDLIVTVEGTPMVTFSNDMTDKSMSIWTFGNYDPSVTNIRNIPEAKSLSVFPNPVSDVIIINTDATVSGILEIFNAQGQLIQRSEYNNNLDQIQIPCMEWESGQYFLRLTSENDIYVGAVIKH